MGAQTSQGVHWGVNEGQVGVNHLLVRSGE